MAKKISLLDIAKAKLSSKENLPHWYEERLKICQTCPLNSINKPRSEWTTQEKTWVTLNQGKPTCLACRCEIAAKASLPHATCGKKVIGLEPEWKPINTIAKTSKQKIEHIPTDEVNVKELKGETIFDFGNIKSGEPKYIKLSIEDIDNNMHDIQVHSSCGCTVPKLEKKGKHIGFEMKYKNETTGEFNKTVVLSYIQNNMKFEKIFKIKGNAQ